MTTYQEAKTAQQKFTREVLPTLPKASVGLFWETVTGTIRSYGLVVNLETSDLIAKIPDTYEGVDVRTKVTGKVVAAQTI